MRQSVHG
jgi:hypothetical protein